jgi:hypothetical protein
MEGGSTTIAIYLYHAYLYFTYVHALSTYQTLLLQPTFVNAWSATTCFSQESELVSGTRAFGETSLKIPFMNLDTLLGYA